MSYELSRFEKGGIFFVRLIVKLINRQNNIIILIQN
jgi:hypothetical protein